MKLGSSFAPLRHQPFRRIWSASILSNFGLLINGVGAGWAMIEMSGKAENVALVQSALMMPFMLFSLPAGAVADTYDRRKVTIAALMFALASAMLMIGFAAAHLLTPTLLLLLCFLSGSANAMFGPAWQASVGEQVPRENVPAAVALNSVSYNIARSFGPAVGGLIVAAAGSVAAFGAAALCYLPIVLAFYLWRRVPDTPRLPPERIGSAIVSGLRYVGHSPAMRAIILRSVLTGVSGASISSLMPLIARDMVAGGPATYGLLLGGFGVGAVFGALLMPVVRARLGTELHVGGSTLLLGLVVVALSFTRSLWLAIPLLVFAGACWMQPMTIFNIAIQGLSPRWVTGRGLAAFQASIAGGIAAGAWLWGMVAGQIGTAGAVGWSGLALVGCALAGRLWRFPHDDVDLGQRPRPLSEVDFSLDLTGRSGPIVIEISYRVASDNARAFYDAMVEVGRFRRRNGAYQWSLARDVTSVESWLERFSCPTWHDYLRQRDRMTAGEQRVLDRAAAETLDGRALGVRRLLERPTGSVRWRAESRDLGVVMPFNPSSS